MINGSELTLVRDREVPAGFHITSTCEIIEENGETRTTGAAQVITVTPEADTKEVLEWLKAIWMPSDKEKQPVNVEWVNGKLRTK